MFESFWINKKSYKNVQTYSFERINMKKFVKMAQVAMAAALLLTGTAQAHPENDISNWQERDSKITWMNGTGELCWQNNFWTQDTASTEKCGKPAAPAPVVAQPVVAAPAAPMVMPPVAAPTPEAVAKPQIVTEKFSYAADALFDFNKSVLKDEGRVALDDLAAKLQDPAMKLEVVVAVGHTDSIGKDSYNDALSLSRANAVKEYLVSKGLNPALVFAEGKGKRQLKVDAASCPKKRADRIVCEAANRRVEVEVTGNKTVTKMVN
jgi:OmpA-OmpF porin, OOP family